MLYKRKNCWHMDDTVNGVWYREALHTTDRPGRRWPLRRSGSAKFTKAKAPRWQAANLHESLPARPQSSFLKNGSRTWPRGPMSLNGTF